MEYVYHGSAQRIPEVIPKRNVRRDSLGGVIWDKTSFHATPYKWIALAYIRKKDAEETTGVDLYREKKVIEIYGRTTLEDALRNLYGSGGYIYTFDAKDFSWEEGLGNLEVFTSSSIRPIKEEHIVDPVTDMKKLGIEFVFIRTDEPKGWNK